MKVNVYGYPNEETLLEREVELEDIVSDIDRIEARYNLETYGRYWAFGIKKTYAEPRSSYVLLMRT